MSTIKVRNHAKLHYLCERWGKIPSWKHNPSVGELLLLTFTCRLLSAKNGVSEHACCRCYWTVRSNQQPQSLFAPFSLEQVWYSFGHWRFRLLWYSSCPGARLAPSLILLKTWWQLVEISTIHACFADHTYLFICTRFNRLTRRFLPSSAHLHHAWELLYELPLAAVALNVGTLVLAMFEPCLSPKIPPHLWK